MRISIAGLIAAVFVLLFNFFIFLVPINIHDVGFWISVIVACFVYAVFNIVGAMLNKNIVFSSYAGSNRFVIPFIIPAVLLAIMMVVGFSGSTLFHAKAYSKILIVDDADFTQDLSKTKGTDSIALMDTDSAQMLGNREIGSLSSVVSQFDVSSQYTQIDYNGSPMKVSALDYVGFFKWINNNDKGIPGYVTVDPVSMSASYTELEKGMIYVPSAYLLEDAGRHIRMGYPTTMWGNLHFEIDEEGNPYYVASVYKKTVSLFAGTTVSGCIILDPTTGDMEKYDLEDVPRWVDMVYTGDMLCEQYNWYGKLSNGFWNSLIGKKGCKQVTTSYAHSEDDEGVSETPDYGYVSKDGDIWIYTGVTSVNSDSSNIGFLMANERTGESHYYSITGADEKSAMAAAEGEVQEKGYVASFPSLINVDDEPTYIMVLKDASGLVKLYAAVNVEQYNLVTTASTQKECLAKYKKLLGMENSEDENNEDDSAYKEVETKEYTITINDIRYIDIDGNTYMYFFTEDNKVYKAKVSTHEDMLFLKVGDTITVYCDGNEIVTYDSDAGKSVEQQ